MKSFPSNLRSLACCLALAFVLSCRSESVKRLSDKSSFMRLTSGHTEIVTHSSNIPGYWAVREGDGETFFLYVLDRSYRKGEVIRVDGAYGTAPASTFDDDTRVYQSGRDVNIFVVWAAEKAGAETGRPQSAKESAER